MSERARLVYDDGTHIDFNTQADALHHCYGPHQGLRGLLRLESVDPDAEDAVRQIEVARAHLAQAGVDAKAVKAPGYEPTTVMTREEINAAVAALVENPEVPPVVQIREPTAEQAKALEETSRIALDAIDAHLSGTTPSED